MSLDEALRAALRQELRAAVQEILAVHTPETVAAPALLDRNGLARALSCSVGHIDKLRREGMPQVLLGDSPRFDLADVIQWLKGRQS